MLPGSKQCIPRRLRFDFPLSKHMCNESLGFELPHLKYIFSSRSGLLLQQRQIFTAEIFHSIQKQFYARLESHARLSMSPTLLTALWLTFPADTAVCTKINMKRYLSQRYNGICSGTLSTLYTNYLHSMPSIVTKTYENGDPAVTLQTVYIY